MEKAFAKLNQNYDRIQGGSGYESLRMLTNMPVFRYEHSREKEIGGYDKSWDKFHGLMGADG